MDAMELAKSAQLDLLIELKRICIKNDIQYFLAGGTLIGAVRHNGFIPWDDDIDVGMLRKDYDKFVFACQTELDTEYRLDDWHMDKASPIPFLKMKIKGTHYRESLAEGTDINDEIYIDIFPYDNVPDNSFKRIMQAVQSYLIRKILLLRCGFSIDENKSVIKRFLYFVLKNLSKIKNIESWKRIYTKIVKKYNDKETLCVASICGAYSYKKETKQRVMVENTVPHMFESVEFLIPKDYDLWLKEIYGDYMELPPVEERKSQHNILRIDFGKYEIRNKIK